MTECTKPWTTWKYIFSFNCTI